jgi:hypothetical protein
VEKDEGIESFRTAILIQRQGGWAVSIGFARLTQQAIQSIVFDFSLDKQ